MGKSVSRKGLAAATLLLLPLAAQAAGLGRLTVLSQLGQPLNAEIEIVSLQPGEEESLVARIASGDAFSQAGIEFNPALLGVRFAVERRGTRPVIRMTSSQPLNEPFVEVLVEMQWNTGRLVREYSFLLDPPEYKGPQPIAAKPAPGVVAKPAAPAPARPEERPIAAAPAKPAPAPVPTPAPAPAKAAATHEVKPGDTLGKIARQNLQPGVTMQQMLVALQRANQDAFIGGNINRLRSGRILDIPSRETAAAIDQAEAARLVNTQSSEYAEYQRKAGAEVARAPAATATPQREASGQIQAKPEAAPPAAPKDQLKLSRPDGAKGAAAKAARGDDAVARERALKEAQTRVTELEKNVGDLQKLLELKNQQLAQLEKKGGPAKPEPAKPEPPKAEAKAPAKEAPKAEVAKAEPPKAAPATPEPAKAEPPKPEPAKAEPAKAEAAKSEPAKAEPPKPVAEAPKGDAPKADAPKAEPPKEVAKAEPPKPKPKPAPPPPPPPPSVMDEFLDNPVALGGLGGVVALLGGYGWWAWRRKKASQSKFQDSVLGVSAAGGAASVLNAGAAGDAPSEGASVSQASVGDVSVGGGEADDVDPIAEADVYMAYGRDAQAEEILKEALGKDPSRQNVYAKLLEIYANRRDAKAFEESALKLKSLTGGEGAEWDKAMALGRSIDPGNGLYGGSGDAPAVEVAAEPAAAPTLDFDIGGGGGGGEATAASTDLSLDLGGGAEEAAAPSSIDFDLGGGDAAPAQEQTDFSPGGTLIVDSSQTQPAASEGAGLDFDLGGGDALAPAAEAPAPAAEPAAGNGMDFDLNLDLGGGTEAPAEAAEAPAAPAGDLALDLSGLSLDLGTPAGDSGAAPAEAGGEKWQEVATKLDLAKAYEEMGDKDGAKELLNEVLKEGDAAQQAQAQQMLAALG